MNFEHWLLLGAAGGLAAYSACYRLRALRHRFRVSKFMHAAGSGAGIVAGIHLALCMFFPGLLVRAGPPPLLDAIHALHIFVGGAATVAISVIWLIELCVPTIQTTDDNEKG